MKYLSPVDNLCYTDKYRLKMTATGHALIGAAIVTKIPDLRISLPLTLASHFLGDALPHWDAGTSWRKKGMKLVFRDSLIDLFAGYFLVFLIFILGLRTDPVKTYLGVFVSQLPDFLEVPYFFLHWKVAPWTWVNDFQHLFHREGTWPWGFLNQIPIVLLFLLWATAIR